MCRESAVGKGYLESGVRLDLPGHDRIVIIAITQLSLPPQIRLLLL